jgi:predicted DNA-binding transcriptional regulator AlpA
MSRKLTTNRLAPKKSDTAPGSDGPALLTKKEAARWMGTSTRTMQRYPEQFPCPVLVGRRYKYLRQDISQWLENRSLSNAG